MNQFRYTIALFCVLFTVLLIGALGVYAQDEELETPEPCSAIEAPELEEPAEPPEELREITLFLGFIPNIQFAPLYVAVEKGYFAEAGLDVSFEYGDENIGVERIAAGDLQFGVVSGEQVVLARAREMPIVYVLEWYQRFAVGVVAPVEQEIVEPEDMAGHVIGIPGRYGASWLGFAALLNAVEYFA